VWREVQTQDRGLSKDISSDVCNLTISPLTVAETCGSSKVRQTTELAWNGNSYSGSGDYAYYDLNGTVV
jgi:hypothetical protein